MPDITWDLKAQMGGLIDEMRKAASAANMSAGKFDELDSSIAALSDHIKTLEAQNKALSESQTKQAKSSEIITKGLKEKERAYARAAENEAKATLAADRTALAQENMTKTLQRVSKAENLTFNSTSTLARVMDEYAEILKEGGDNQGYLLNQWKRSLTPAEKTAQKIAEIAAFSTDAERDTKSWTNSIARNVQKLNEQERRLEANGAAGGRYGMSLREMLQEQTKAISGADRLRGGFSGVAGTMASKVNPTVGAFVQGMGGISPVAMAALGGVTALAAGAAAGFKKAAESAAAFEYAQTMLANKTGLAGDKSEVAAAQISALSNAAIDAGLATKFSAVEATGGLESLVTMGFNVKQATEALRPTLDFATALNLDIAEAARIAAAAQNVFAHENQTLSERLNTLAKATTVSAIQQDDLLMALSKSSRAAGVTGQSMSELIGIMSLAKNAGMSMEEAGTGTSNALLKMAEKSRDGKLAIGDVMVQVADASGNFREFGDIILEISERTAHMGEVARSSALAETFGTRSIGPINAALSAFENGMEDANGAILRGADALTLLREKFSTTGAEIARQSEDLTNTVTGQVQILSGQWDTFWTLMGQKSEGVLARTLQSWTYLFNQRLEFERQGYGFFSTEYSRRTADVAKSIAEGDKVATQALRMAQEAGVDIAKLDNAGFEEWKQSARDLNAAMETATGPLGVEGFAGRWVEYNGVIYDSVTQANDLAEAKRVLTSIGEVEGAGVESLKSKYESLGNSYKEFIKLSNEIATKDLSSAFGAAEGETGAGIAAQISDQLALATIEYELFANNVSDIQGELEDNIVASIQRQVNAEVAAARAREAAIQAAIQQRVSAVQYGGDMAVSALSTLGKAIETFGRDQEKAARLAFLAEQAQAAQSVIINTATAISKGIAMFGPPPSPAGIAAIAAASAIGAAQLAIIGKGTINGLGAGSAGAAAGAPQSAEGATVVASEGAVSSGSTGDNYTGGAPYKGDVTPVSDAYIAPSMGRKTIQMSPGDEGIIMRSGPMGIEGHNRRMEILMSRQIDTMDRMLHAIRQLGATMQTGMGSSRGNPIGPARRR